MKNLVIDSSTKIIEVSAYSGDDEIETVIFEDGDTPLIVEEEAFAYCENLTKVDFGKRKIILGNSAFYCCPFYQLEIPSNVTLGVNCFADNYNLERLTIDTAIIPDYCFINNEEDGELESIYLSDNVVEIGEQAFGGLVIMNELVQSKVHKR